MYDRPYDPEWPWRDSRIDYPLYNSLDKAEYQRRVGGASRRAAGAMLGLAVGDALGAPYEFMASQGITLSGTSADMVGGGSLGWEPGEWTDDTSMAVPILRSQRDDPVRDPHHMLQEWRRWALTA